jgi:hypothetical protein
MIGMPGEGTLNELTLTPVTEGTCWPSSSHSPTTQPETQSWPQGWPTGWK